MDLLPRGEQTTTPIAALQLLLVMIKKITKKKNGSVIINVRECHYDVIRQEAKRRGWQLCEEQDMRPAEEATKVQSQHTVIFLFLQPHKLFARCSCDIYCRYAVHMKDRVGRIGI